VLRRAMGNTNTQDSPWPELGGSHHLLPYSILCNSRRRLHPNGYFSWDSQVGVPKLSRVGVPKLWTSISLDCRLRSRRGLKQSCNSRRFQRRVKLSNRTSEKGQFPTFSGRKSNCQFDSQPFFWP
jgi:hypothetical protein